MMNINIFIVAAGILLLGFAIYRKIRSHVKEGAGAKGFLALLVVGICCLAASASFQIIPTGYTGVRTTFGQIDQVSLQKGFNYKIPLVQSIQIVNNKQQDIRFANSGDQIWGESSEKVQVYMADITCTYQINPEKSAWIYANVSDYENNLLSYSLVASAMKDSASQLQTSEVTVRSKIEPLAKDHIQLALNEKYGKDTVTVLKVVINDMNFEDSYNEAIAQKNIAKQQYEQAQIENEKNVEKAEADAKAALIAAQGKADAAVKEAEGEAEANKLKNDSITDQILRQEFYDKWDGKLPNVIGENGTIVDIGNVVDDISQPNS